MSVDTKLKELIINTLSPEQLPEELAENEIYLVEDDEEYATTTELTTGLSQKQDTISDLDTIRSDASSGAAAATTISGYGDIVTHNASEFAAPGDIPTKTSDLTNDSGFITNSVNNLTNYTLTSGLATVATSGRYNDLTDTPTIPVVPTNVSAFTNDSGYVTDDYHDSSKQDKLTSENAGTNITITETEGKVTISAASTTSIAWGNLTGSLSDQTDLNNELTNIKDDISNLQARGRFLSLWNCAEGKPTTEPESEDEYAYKTGDYFIVGSIATTEGAKNYKPTGTTYTKGQAASTVEETDEVSVDDVYYYDGSAWKLQVNHGKTVSFANLAGQPTDNTALSTALSNKQDKISNLSTIESNASAGAGAATTIAGYGDIVTHNASEFATPGDIPTKTSDLTNDSGYITSDYHDNTKQNTLSSSDTVTVEDGVVNTNNIVWRKW